MLKTVITKKNFLVNLEDFLGLFWGGAAIMLLLIQDYVDLFFDSRSTYIPISKILLCNY